MKRRFLPIALLLAGSLAAANAYAQENTLRVEKKLIERSGDYLLVDLTLNLSDLVVRSNRSVTYTPVIQRGDSLRRLPALIVNGRNRQILYERTGRDIATDGEFAVRRKNGTEQRFDYHARVPYARWMDCSEMALAIARTTARTRASWRRSKRPSSPCAAINTPPSPVSA